MASFTVKVVNDNQEGISGVRVRLAFTDIDRAMSNPEYTTDDDGRADFDGYDDGEIEVFIDGSSYGTYQYVDEDEITITK